jgi:hypothetical protein
MVNPLTGTAELMLFKIPKLFGFDVRAEIAAVSGQIEQRVAAVRSQIEQRVDELEWRARHAAPTVAIIVGLWTFSGLLFTMAVGVGLIALYRAEAETHGVNMALAVVATALVAAALILLVIARMMGKSLSKTRAAKVLYDLVGSVAAAPAFALARRAPPPKDTLVSRERRHQQLIAPNHDNREGGPEARPVRIRKIGRPSGFTILLLPRRRIINPPSVYRSPKQA